MKIQIKKSNLSGLGVFALETILKGEVIEIVPLIILSKKEILLIDKTKLYNYYFSLKNNQYGLALGYGSLYNHSYTPNCKYKKKSNTDFLEFISLIEIKKGDEILVNYNGNSNSKEKVWFEK